MDWASRVTEPPFQISALLLLGMLFVIILLHLHSRQEQAWQEIASVAGMTLLPPTVVDGERKPWRVSGVFRGRKLVMDTVTRLVGSAEFSRPAVYTRITGDVQNKVGGSFEIERRLLFGASNPHVDPGFDRRFVVSSHPGDFAARIFKCPKVRGQLLRADFLGAGLKIDKLQFAMLGVKTDIQAAISMFHLVCNIAEAVEDYQSLDLVVGDAY